MAYSVIAVTVATLLLFGAYVYPYAGAAILKAKMLKRLVEATRREGFRYRRSFRSIFFTRNLSRKYDMIIYNEKKLYAVKLWSSYFAYNRLVLMRNGRIREERRMRAVFDMNGRPALYAKGPAMRVPRIKLHKKYAKGREVEGVLLVYPSYESIIAEDGRGAVSLKTGDMLFDKTLYSPSAFLRKLKEKS